METRKDEILKRRSKLSLAQQALLTKRLRGEVDSRSQLEIIPKRSQISPAPLSFAQQRLWFLQQLDIDNPYYSELACVQLLGALNVDALERSLNEIVRRHEALRTTFEMLEEEAIQIIHPAVTMTLPVVNLLSMSEAKRQAQVERLTTEIAQKPFNLVTGPLLRVMLLQTGAEEYLLLFTIHHIAVDGWSIGVLIRELAGLYEAFSTGKASPLPDISIQYADFAIWQRQWLQGELQKTQLDYWKQQLADASTLALPTDRPRPPIQSFRGAIASFELSASLTDMLRSLSNQEGVTLFMTLLGAFQALLYRYTGQEDICVGSPIANRNQAEIQGLIGFFVNTLVLRTHFSGNTSFLELLNRVREVCVGAYAHADIPFEQLVEELQPDRNLSQMPLFQVMFAWQEDTQKELKLPGLTLNWLPTHGQTAKFDLTLHLVDAQPELRGFLEYNTDLFDAETVIRIVEHFRNLLEGIVANPQARLSDLPLLTAEELHQQLVEWNNTQVEYPEQQCIHQLFEAQVERTPDAVAVVFEDEQLTYCELNAKANQLAHYLKKLGVKPEILVGICVERSLSTIVSLLGILKAGGAYVPIDPAYPPERIAFILEDAQAPVLLTTALLLEAMPQNKAKVVCLDTDWHLVAQQSQENLFSEVTTDNLAYVIYTSGSTGRPKGVMIKHASTVAMLDWANKTFAIEAMQGVLASTSICFDLSVFEVFVPLCCGGKVILIENALYLPTLPTAQNVTLINTVPSVISQLLRTDSIPTSVQTINIAGEPLHNQLVQQLYQQDNIQQVFNLYGPSEDTTYSTSAWIHKDTNNIPPIGRPIHNTQIYLLDKNYQPVPVGVPGMLYIGGAGLSRGYLNKPELTADKFIPNPYANLPGERLYKTGDLGRYLPSGEIEYIGRIDYQVKIRGFRIELGEIEALIIKYPKVREAVVTVHSLETDSQQIVAYLVPNSEQTLTISELRDFLEAKLPNYMVPTAFVILEMLPLTPNGKIDRKALKAPDTIRPEDKELLAPRNYVETKLAEIWAAVLGVDKVGIFDNFFELGGDSILAIVVITKAKQAGLQLAVKQLFQHQTVAGLASVAVAKKVKQAEQGLITGLASLTPIQYWFFEQNLLEPHHWNQAVLLEVKQVLDLAVLEKSVQQLLLHHDALRLRFEQTESSWQQVIASPDAEIPWIHLDFSALSATEQELAIETAATKLQASLNLSTGPLIRVALFDLGQQPSHLLIVIHHLAVDGVSWRILLEDLETAYQLISQGKKVQLPAKTTSFKYWSECLQEYAQSATLQQQWDYWLRESWQKIAPLPVDFADGDNTVASAQNISIFLTEEQTQILLKEVPKAYNTQINDVLLAALVQAFSQWTGNNSLLLALEGHGREEIFDNVDLSRTVGWFTSIFPVLLDLGTISHSVEALKSIKEQLRSIPNKGMGYGVLRYLSKDTARIESLRSLPQAEVVFNYLGQFDRTFSDSSIFKISQGSQGQTRSLCNREAYMLNINALVVNNQLRVDWTYSEKIHRRSTIERLAQGFVEALQILMTHCHSPKVGGYTPSDFPEADFNQQDLDLFLEKINRGSKNKTL
ncbi:MAG: amino acid adenylation domain-containing protein [Nostoc sp. DedQUE08]|uniref:non-ribosomal peptide synthetase n=1 Tax=Nostoc sp. DedQUE08 TaxID=3075393 RepID=UPI002AD53BE3|nr:non-ribosomal peptide synthetase [Nostoc sp. DedQUE08]MDZ8067339.1 amino acid adenylation domain-containing protein [Nostoc sp. DedQUE08]